VTRLSDPVGSDTYDERDTRGQRRHEAEQEAWEARTEGIYGYRAKFVGLGADQPLELAPFPSEAERRAYFDRVRAMNAEHKRRREEQIRDAAT